MWEGLTLLQKDCHSFFYCRFTNRQGTLSKGSENKARIAKEDMKNQIIELCNIQSWFHLFTHLQRKW